MHANSIAPGRVILIGGWQRSATTLWLKLMGGHPRTAIVPTDHAILDHKLELLALRTGIAVPDTRERMREACRHIVDHPGYAKWGLTLSQLEQQLESVPRSWDGVFLAMLRAFQAEHPGKVPVLKTPGSERYFPRLRALLAEHGWSPRFLYSVRNPVDAYLSWKHRSHSWHNTAQVDARPTLWCSYWLDSTMSALEFGQAHPDLLLTVRMRDLLSQPRPTIAAACRHFGLEDCAAEMVNNPALTANSSFDSRDLPTVDGKILDVRARPHSSLTAYEAAVLHRTLSARAAAFGFDLSNLTELAEGAAACEHQVAMELMPTWAMMNAALRLVSRRTFDYLWSPLNKARSVLERSKPGPPPASQPSPAVPAGHRGATA